MRNSQTAPLFGGSAHAPFPPPSPPIRTPRNDHLEDVVRFLSADVVALPLPLFPALVNFLSPLIRALAAYGPFPVFGSGEVGLV